MRSGVWYGISISSPLLDQRPGSNLYPIGQSNISKAGRYHVRKGEREGAGKKPTGWESDLPRASQSVGGRSSFTDPERDVLSQEGPGMSELSLFL